MIPISIGAVALGSAAVGALAGAADKADIVFNQEDCWALCTSRQCLSPELFGWQSFSHCA